MRILVSKFLDFSPKNGVVVKRRRYADDNRILDIIYGVSSFAGVDPINAGSEVHDEDV